MERELLFAKIKYQRNSETKFCDWSEVGESNKKHDQRQPWIFDSLSLIE